MVTCQNCGTEMEDEAKFCRNCGSEIVVEEDESEIKFCSKCGFEMPKATKFCPECGSPTDRAPQTVSSTNRPVVVSDKSSFLAAVLSFFIIGLGQVYIGLTKKGIILFCAAIVAGILTLVIIGFVLWFLIWVYAIYDAYNSCEKMNQGIAVEDTLDLQNLF